MALTEDSFADQTVPETSQQACCLEECDQQAILLPDEFTFLVIDALQRATDIDLAAIEVEDLKTVVENARCSLGDRTGFCTITDTKAQAIILYLLNELLAD